MRDAIWLATATETSWGSSRTWVGIFSRLVRAAAVAVDIGGRSIREGGRGGERARATAGRIRLSNRACGGVCHANERDWSRGRPRDVRVRAVRSGARGDSSHAVACVPTDPSDDVSAVLAATVASAGARLEASGTAT